MTRRNRRLSPIAGLLLSTSTLADPPAPAPNPAPKALTESPPTVNVVQAPPERPDAGVRLAAPRPILTNQPSPRPPSATDGGAAPTPKPKSKSRSRD